MHLCASHVNIEWCAFVRDDSVWARVLRPTVQVGYAPVAGMPWWRHFTMELESCLAEYPGHERYPFAEQIGSFWKVMHIVELLCFSSSPFKYLRAAVAVAVYLCVDRLMSVLRVGSLIWIEHRL